jgi:poly-gamma-glutamate synthesis protein (capsule biosynthesis protein)
VSSVFDLPEGVPLTLAAAGDIVISRPVALTDRDAAFEATVDVVRGASMAIANLEMNLLSPEHAATARSRADRRWAFGTAREAAEIRSLGFDLVGQANNHALDYGTEGMHETRAELTAAGLMTAGSGRDLDEAGAPIVAGRGERRIAVLAVAISSSSADAAMPRRGSSTGWPGINALRYRAEVTADADTYEALRQAAPLRQEEGGGGQFTLHGAVIRKGVETSVNLVADTGDTERILAAIAAARAEAGVVVVSLHGHEPSDRSQEPADFARAFARQAIDAGARLVVGHGPHRLRGVEMYNGGAILHSLGNFLYQVEEGQPSVTDSYGTGLDMFSLAMGMGAAGAADRSGTDADAWWKGAVAVATFDGDRLAALRLHPVDLGRQLPAGRIGLPRTPAAPQATSILETLVRLSQRLGTTIQIENGVGHVRMQ